VSGGPHPDIYFSRMSILNEKHRETQNYFGKKKSKVITNVYYSM